MITELRHLGVNVATLTVPGSADQVERRVEIIDLRTGDVVVSLLPAGALEVGRKVTARARLLLR